MSQWQLCMYSFRGSLVAPMGQERQDWLCRLSCSTRWSPVLTTDIRKAVRVPALSERHCCGTGNRVFRMHCMYARRLTYRSNRIHSFPLNPAYFISSVVLVRFRPLLPFSLRGSGLTDHPLHLWHSTPSYGWAYVYSFSMDTAVEQFSIIYCFFLFFSLCWNYWYSFICCHVFISLHIFQVLGTVPGFPSNTFSLPPADVS